MSEAVDLRRTGPLRGSFARLRHSAGWNEISGPFFRKYVALFLAAVCIILLSSAVLDIWFSSRELKDALVRVQREQAVTASGTIEHFIDGIETELRWSVQLPWSAETFEQRRFDGLRLIQQAPAISELVEIDPSGHERLRLSRTAVSIVDGGADLSQDEAFVQAIAHKV